MRTPGPWRTSARCESHSCVQWRTSSHCGNGACIACGLDIDIAHVRDTKLADSPTLSFSAPAWRAFLDVVADLGATVTD